MLWDTRYLRQFGNAIRGLECIEAAGAPVTFEVTGFTVSSKAPRANVRLLGIQSEQDGTLVLAVRKPHIPLHCKRQSSESNNVDAAMGQRSAVTYKGQDMAELKYRPLQEQRNSKMSEVDVPLQRPLRLRGHVEVIRT